MGMKITTDIIINRCKETHGDKYDYSRVKYKGYDEKIEIICKQHGSFWQDARNHYKLKTGCPICANNVRYSVKSFIDKASAVHNQRYDYSQISKYINNKTKVPIICK